MADNVVDVKINASTVNLRLEQFPDDVRRELLYTIELTGGQLVDLARSRAESLLAVRTGNFVGRIRFGLKRKKNSLYGRVFSSAKTANLFEWGGKTGAHEILPDKAKALLIAGSKFAARVHHPGGHYKRLEIIHGAFDQMKPQIKAGLEDAVAGAVERINA